MVECQSIDLLEDLDRTALRALLRKTRRRIDEPRRGRLFQEDLLDQPFWMLVCCQLVNLTNWDQASPVYLHLRSALTDELGMSAAREEDLHAVLRPLGLWRRRARSLVGLARAFSSKCPITAADVARLPGCGRYAADSWAIFVEGRTDVDPTDGKLSWYLRRLRSNAVAYDRA